MFEAFKLWRKRRRERRANKIRRLLKREVLIDDARRFFNGEYGAEKSRQNRDAAYQLIDEIPIDELLKD